METRSRRLIDSRKREICVLGFYIFTFLSQQSQRVGVSVDVPVAYCVLGSVIFECLVGASQNRISPDVIDTRWRLQFLSSF